MTWWIVTLTSAALLIIGGLKCDAEEFHPAWLVVAALGGVGVVVGSAVLWTRTGVFG